MVTKSTDEAAVREYLLGVLAEPVSEEIEQKLLTNDEFAETVDLIEDELIDEFLDGILAQAERRALENHFLQAPEHRRKLEFARLLRSHFRPESESVPAPVPWFHSLTSYRTLSLGFACLLVMALGLAIYSLRLRKELASEMARVENAETALQISQNQAQARIAELEKQLNVNAATVAVNGAPIILNLLAPVTRENGPGTSINCSPGGGAIEVHIPLVNGAASSYDAVLQSPGGQELWSKTNIRAAKTGAAKQLSFTIPNSLACHQQYSLVITGKGDLAGAHYAFTIR